MKYNEQMRVSTADWFGSWPRNWWMCPPFASVWIRPRNVSMYCILFEASRFFPKCSCWVGGFLGFFLSLSLNLKELLIVTAWTLLRTGLDLLKQLGRRVSGVSGLGSLEPEKCDPIDDFTIFYYWLWPNH